MPKEIEKKYRVVGFTSRQIPTDAKSMEILQIYLKRDDRPGIECRIRRKLICGKNSYYYTEKTPTDQTGVRSESEEAITEERYWFLLTRYVDSTCKPIAKSRFKFEVDGHILELDVYEGELDGLVTLEIEFPDEDSMARFVPPTFLNLVDVTGDKRYSNRMLAEKGIPQF